MTTTPNDPTTDPVPEETTESPETDPDGLPQPDPEVARSGEEQPGQVPDHDTEIGA